MLVTCIISVVLTKQARTEAVHHIDEVNVIRIGDAVTRVISGNICKLYTYLFNVILINMPFLF